MSPITPADPDVENRHHAGSSNDQNRDGVNETRGTAGGPSAHPRRPPWRGWDLQLARPREGTYTGCPPSGLTKGRDGVHARRPTLGPFRFQRMTTNRQSRPTLASSTRSRPVRRPAGVARTPTRTRVPGIDAGLVAMELDRSRQGALSAGGPASSGARPQAVPGTTPPVLLTNDKSGDSDSPSDDDEVSVGNKNTVTVVIDIPGSVLRP